MATHMNMICFLDRLVCVCCRIPFERWYAAGVRCFLSGNKSVEVSDKEGRLVNSLLGENVRRGKQDIGNLSFL